MKNLSWNRLRIKGDENGYYDFRIYSKKAIYAQFMAFCQNSL